MSRENLPQDVRFYAGGCGENQARCLSYRGSGVTFCMKILSGKDAYLLK